MTERPQDLVAAGYDLIAERYAAWQAGVRGDPRERYVASMLERLPSQPRILEIGCGPGVEPTPTSARLGRLTAIDISQAQIDHARAAVPGVRLIHGDIVTAGFPAASFDAVVALYVLTHVPSSELPALLRRIASWLAPCGTFLATFGGRGPHDSFVDDWLGAPMFFSGFDPPANERLVAAAGLTIVESRVEPMREPESEPGQGEQTVAFHWVLAEREASRLPTDSRP